MIDFFNFERMKYWTPSKNVTSKVMTLLEAGDYIASLKKDGEWAVSVNINNRYQLQGRGKSKKAETYGEYIDKSNHVPHISSVLSSEYFNNCVVIGEIYLENERANEVSSILRSLPEKALQKQKDKKLRFYVFDIIMWDGEDLTDYDAEQRIKYINNLKQRLEDIGENEYFDFAEYFDSGIWDAFGAALSKGEEGLVCLRKNSKYYFKKSPSWTTIKLKEELDDEVDAFFTGKFKGPNRLYTGKEIITWEYWENTITKELINGPMFESYNEGMTIEPVTKRYFNRWVGSLEIAVYKDNKITPIGYVSNLTDELSNDYAKNPDKYIMMPVSVSAMSIFNTTSKLRQGKLIRLRDDIDPQDCTWEKMNS